MKKIDEIISNKTLNKEQKISKITQYATKLLKEAKKYDDVAYLEKAIKYSQSQDYWVELRMKKSENYPFDFRPCNKEQTRVEYLISNYSTGKSYVNNLSRNMIIFS